MVLLSTQVVAQHIIKRFQMPTVESMYHQEKLAIAMLKKTAIGLLQAGAGYVIMAIFQGKIGEVVLPEVKLVK